MSLNISAYSIRQPVPAIVLFVVLCFLGWMSFLNLPITRFPNIDVPFVSVTVTQSGAAPAELETQVARKIEEAVANITGVKNVMTTLTDGSSVTLVEFRLEVPTDRALTDVKDAIAKIRAELPRTIDEPIIERVDIENQPIMTVAVTDPAMTMEQLSWFVDDVVRREMQGLKGIGRISRYGGVTREIRVSLVPDRLMALGITAGDVSRQLRATNVDLAGGRGDVAGQEQSIRTLASAATVESLAATKIVLPGGREVRLSDLGEVTDLYEEPRAFARINGETPMVAFQIYRSKGASDVRVAALARARIDEMRKAYPNIVFNEVDNSVNDTAGNYHSAMEMLAEGALLTVIVVFLFLRDFRATLISAIALPLSIIPTFWAMELMGFSLNLVSLLAIILVTGILVDDAIVEIENIVRHMKMGKSPYRAAMEAADEIGLAVIAISLTIVAVFAPVSFMGGIAGQYFKQFGLVVAIAVLFSLLVARLITPMLAAYFLRSHSHREPKDGALMRGYLRFLSGTMRWRYVTLIAGLVVFAVSIYAIRFLPTGFVPFPDDSRFVISVELPPGSTLEDTQRRTDALAALIRREIPETRSIISIGGANPIGVREIRRATVIVKLVHKTERSRTQRQIQQAVSGLFAQIPDIRAYYIGGNGERELSIIVRGNDVANLNKAVADLETEMRRLPGFVNVAAAAGLDRPEIRVVPRPDEAARYGVTTDQISEAVRIATIGDIAPNLARFNAGDRLIPIRVQLDTAARTDVDLLSQLTVTTATGAQVPLSAVAEVSFGQGPSSLERFNRARRINIGADLTPGLEIGPALEMIYALPAAKNLPPGVSFQRGGDAEIMAEVFQGFAIAMGTGILMVLGVLVLLFHSLFQPLTILMSLPLSLGGVIIALLLTNNAISMPVVIGILMLMGIVTKNAIMLVDFAVERVREGVPRTEAMLDAGRKRARPIIMTTIAMAVGMIPPALGTGDGGEFRAPMAIAVIGGLIVSTVLSLVFVPSFYTVMDDVGRFFGWIFGRFVGPADEADEAHGGHRHGAPQAPPHAAQPSIRVAAE
ncbi:efflux RND transporter permease subunit [Phreatobacter sp. AB_2022a]|uniref:efflux RND transporter permease subunit n=1 Tax=Phreatobacter sp. AB_2022a TaxID=3003134 RepID=UPI0005710D50|nr:efflux RND transporter permease subunit [Phreatobacter sp. AB_2022a]MCZ0734998.1 efflux RND transporter permease subunit [Phreatobacter sp. AB_2022a]CEJ10673.1 Multidrug resistance protein MdtB [bacterium YEK0313]